MSISFEYALANMEKPAVLCCRAEAGIIIREYNLEDPAIFDDLIEGGLLNVDGALSIGQALNAKLIVSQDSLTPITAEMVEGINESKSWDEETVGAVEKNDDGKICGIELPF